MQRVIPDKIECARLRVCCALNQEETKAIVKEIPAVVSLDSEEMGELSAQPANGMRYSPRFHPMQINHTAHSCDQTKQVSQFVIVVKLTPVAVILHFDPVVIRCCVLQDRFDSFNSSGRL